MKREELEKKYEKKLIKEIFQKGLLDGCTVGINKDGSHDIYECDIERAIKELNGLGMGLNYPSLIHNI